MLSTLITKIGIPALVTILAEALGRVDNPVTKGAAKALGEVDEAIRSGGVSLEQLTELNRHAEVIAKAEAEEYKIAIEQVNTSLRAEIASEDKYVRRMRRPSVI